MCCRRKKQQSLHKTVFIFNFVTTILETLFNVLMFSFIALLIYKIGFCDLFSSGNTFSIVLLSHQNCFSKPKNPAFLERIFTLAFLASDIFFHLPAEAHLSISLWQNQHLCFLPNITIAPQYQG